MLSFPQVFGGNPVFSIRYGCPTTNFGHDKNKVLRVIEWVNLLHLPLFAKEGNIASLWQREVRRDFLNNVTFLMVY
jgi:hypothetical protein